MALIRFKPLYRRLLWTAAVLACLPLVLHLILPVVVNLKQVRARIIERASGTISGPVDFQRLEPALFPLPHLKVMQGRAAHGDAFRLRVAQVVIYPRVWPLILGRFAIARLKIIEPQVAIVRSSGPPVSRSQPSHPSARTLQDQITNTLALVAGTARIGIQQGRIELSEAGQGRARDIQITGLDLDVQFNSQTQNRIQAVVQAKAPGVIMRAGTGAATLRQIALDGRVDWTPRQVEVSISRLQAGSPRIQMSGTATWPADASPLQEAIRFTLNGGDLDLSRIREAMLQLAGDAPPVHNLFGIVRGGQVSDLRASFALSDWRGTGFADSFQLGCQLKDGRISIPLNLLDMQEVSGNVMLTHGRLAADHIMARFENTHARNGTLTLGLWDGSKALSVQTDLDVDLSQLPGFIKKLVRSPESVALLERLPAVQGRAAGRLTLGDRVDRLSVGFKAAGNVHMLDATLDLSGMVKNLSTPAASGELTLKGHLGSQAVQWLAQRADVPVPWRPASPFTVMEGRLTRTPEGKLELSADLSPAEGLLISLEVVQHEAAIDLEKLHIQDAFSDALVTGYHQSASSQWDLTFRGALQKSTVAQLWPQTSLRFGSLQGDLQVHIDLAAPEHSVLYGRLETQDVDLPVPSLGPVKVLTACLEGRGKTFAVSSATLQWAKHTADLNGSVMLRPQMLDLDLKVDTDTLNVDQLLQAARVEHAKHATDPSQVRAHRLKVQGKVDLRASQADFGGYRFAPLQAAIGLRDGQTSVAISRADLCGISAPGQIRITPKGLKLEFKPHAAGAVLRDTEACLAGTPITERLEGVVKADGRISSRGETREALIRNLSGRVNVTISDGRVYNAGAAGFFTNLLSFISVNQLIRGGLPDLRKNDFRYKSLESKLSLKDGRLYIEEGVLKSNSVNIVANGDYAFSTKTLDLKLLVSPLTSVDWIIEHIPVVGHILQGTLVAVPVGVKGPLDNPTVVPLSPSAVGSRLGGILERTLKTPFRILSPLWKGNSKADP